MGQPVTADRQEEAQAVTITADRRRARNAESERAKRGRRADAGRCRQCGAPLAVLDPAGGKPSCSAMCRNPSAMIAYASCLICRQPFVVRAGTRNNCRNAECRRKIRAAINARNVPSETARANTLARLRNRHYLRRTAVSDITPEQELAMRRKARQCPLCGVRMTGKAGLPNSKHLDHIIPICVGGTHTHGNTRIVCARCNHKRPDDGSDYSGPVTLWATDPAVMSRTPRKGGYRNTETCRSGLHPWVPENINDAGGRLRCRLCEQAKKQEDNRKAHPQQACPCGQMFSPQGVSFLCPGCTEGAGHKAAVLHASGMTWAQVAAELGYRAPSSAWLAAKRVGHAPERQRRNGSTRRGQDVSPDRTKKAQRAAEMRARGMTLRAIADSFGYRSVTSIAKLLENTDITISDSAT